MEKERFQIDEVQEVLSLISKLNGKQKEIVLATLRGAVLIADAGTSSQKGA